MEIEFKTDFTPPLVHKKEDIEHLRRLKQLTESTDHFNLEVAKIHEKFPDLKPLAGHSSKGGQVIRIEPRTAAALEKLINFQRKL